MGIILKENNLVYTKMRHEKFLGSSKYKFHAGKNMIYKKEKLKPNVPTSDNESLSINPTDLAEKIAYYGKEHPLAKFEDKPIQPHHTPRPKKTTYTLNKKKVREKCSAFFGLKQSRKFLAFYTFSFPQNFPDDNAYQCLNTVLTRMREECGLKSYLWVTERQKNETIHFHMLTNNFMYVRKVNHFMARAINNQIKSKKNRGKIKVNFDIRSYNGVDVRHVNNNRKALNCYLTKYVSKNSATFHRLPYYSSHDISELFTAETFLNANCDDFSHIRKALKHINTFVVDNEWATIEYLCQKQDNGKWFNPPDEWYWLRDLCNEQIYLNHHSKMNLSRLPLHQSSKF